MVLAAAARLLVRLLVLVRLVVLLVAARLARRMLVLARQLVRRWRAASSKWRT